MSDAEGKEAETARREVRVEPSLLRAWRGLWILTWKSRLTWRSAPGLLLTVLTIPLLTFFTLESMKRWAERMDWREEPSRQVNAFRVAAAQARIPFPRDLASKLARIVEEEQGATPAAGASSSPSSSPAASSRSLWSMEPEDLRVLSEEAQAQQLEQARQCSERVSARARGLLDPKQFEIFERTEFRRLERLDQRVKRSVLDQVRPFYRWLIDFYFMLALPLYCLASCGSIIRDEIQSDTLRFLTTRPLKRAGLFLGKYCCQVLWLECLAAVHGLLLYASGFARETPGAIWTMSSFFVAQFLAVFAWGALSALLGLITRRYLLLGLAYGFIVEVGIGRIPTNVNSVALTRHLQGFLGHNPVLGQLYDWAPQNLWISVGALLVAVVVFLLAGAVLFTFREYHHATEMQR
jgi:hypothetical protein